MSILFIIVHSDTVVPVLMYLYLITKINLYCTSNACMNISAASVQVGLCTIDHLYYHWDSVDLFACFDIMLYNLCSWKYSDMIYIFLLYLHPVYFSLFACSDIMLYMLRKYSTVICYWYIYYSCFWYSFRVSWYRRSKFAAYSTLHASCSS